MVARWYRPPEIILGLKKYDSQVDVWRAGCIIAELIKAFYKPQDEDRILFRGSSCFSTSPLNKNDKSNNEIEIDSDD